MMTEKKIATFEEFYPFYLDQHSHFWNRITHFIGTSIFLFLAVLAIVKTDILIFFIGIFSAYFFAWIGHFFIEKNKPATFKYPWMSLKGDFKLYFEICTGKQKFNVKK